MRLDEQYLPPASKLMDDYINGGQKIRRYFSYEPSSASFAGRYEKLKEHKADRPALSRVLRGFMEPHGISQAAEKHLKDFEEGAPVVVTGQQAGILSGPLYTVHKAISVIVLARQATEQLQTKVVPVFWIAGEDHDLAEISHVYREVNGRMDKLNFPHTEYGKKTASTAELNKPKIRSYLEEYFRSFPETEHSKELQKLTIDFLENSKSFTDFFTSFLHYFFSEEGLLYIDAADPNLRQYESAYFISMIENSEAVAKSVSEAERELSADGYGASIGAEENAANLFVTVKGERILLERDGQNFTGNSGAVSFTKEQLLDIAANESHLLSNNVVTRPLMQEMVFPVLAFVGGPGEIAYWAALKGAFGIFGMEMPVILPRLGMTLVNRQVQMLMDKYRLTLSELLIDRKASLLKADLLESVREKEAEELLETLGEKLKSEYEEIQESFSSISGGLTPLVEKNLQFHLKQLAFLKNKLEDEVVLQNQIQFSHYACLENQLLPDGSLQERMYSPYPYMNEYGLDLVQGLLKLDYKYDKNHKIVYL